MIQRHVSNSLESLIGEFPAIALTGPRQVGKTTLALSIMESWNKDSIYLDLENPRDVAKLNDPMLFFEQFANHMVIIDEVQRQPELFPILRSAIDSNRIPGRFILLGSASPSLLHQSAESLAGRIHYLELAPFTITELQRDQGDWAQLLLRGGYPESYLARSEETSVRWRESFNQTYFERDLQILGLNLSPNETHRLMRMLAHLHGQLLNFSALGNSLGITSPTAKKYVNFLEQAYLIETLGPFSGNLSKRLTRAPKLFFRDSGMVNALLRIQRFEDFLGHPQAGAIWEGFVHHHIREAVGFRAHRSHYRTSNGAEIDLVLEFDNGRRIGVEMKLGSSPKATKGHFDAMTALSLERLIFVIPGVDHFPMHASGITAMGLEVFLDHIPGWL